MPYKQVSIITKKWRNQKPSSGSQINWGHPLAQGLVGCWLMNEGAGKTVNDLARKNSGTNIGARWDSHLKGMGLVFDGTDDYIEHLDSDGLYDFSSGRSFSISCLAYFNANGVDFAIVNAWGVSPTKEQWLLLREGTAPNADSIKFAVQDTNGNYIVADSVAGTAVAGRWHHVVCVKRQNTLYVYVNMVVSADNPNTVVATLISYPGKIRFGRTVRDSDPLNGKINNVSIYARALSSSEVRSLYEAPYQFIQPIRRRVHFIIPSAASLPFNRLDRIKSISRIKSLNFKGG